jgi:CHAT domain-containing protein/uncharacterized protein HemY
MKKEPGKLLQFFIMVFVFSLCLPSYSVVTAQTVDPETEQRAVNLELTAQKSALQWNRAAIQNAVRSFSEAAGIWLKLNKQEKAANCFREAGKLSSILGFKENAANFFNKGIALSDNPEFKDEQAKIYSELSVLELYSGQIEKSENYFKKALFLAEQSKSQSARASALFSAAEYYYARNQLNNSLNSYKNAIELWKEVKDVRQEANALLNLAYLYLKQNEYSAGFDALNSALAKWQENGDVRGQALTYKAIGRFYNEINEKQKALDSFQKSEKLFAEDLDYAEKASLFNGIAIVYENFGELKLAMNYRIRAFELFQKEDHFYGQIATLPDLARLSFLIEDYSSAENYLLKGENLASKIKDDFYLGLIYEQYGNLYLKKQEFEKSLDYFQKSVKIFRAKSQMWQMSRVLNKIGQIYEFRNDYPAARKYFAESLEFNRNVKDKLGEADTIYHLAKLDSLSDRETEALVSIKNSINITESFYTDVVNSKLKSKYFSTVFERYDFYINLLMKLHKKSPSENFALEALQTAEKSRARAMLEKLSLSEANFTKDADAEAVKREKEIRVLLNAKADKLTDLLSQNADKSETDKISGEINELENELENLKAQLKQQSPVYSAIKNPAPFDVGEFQREVLDENSLLLEFSFGKDESYLWLVGKNELGSYVLPPREAIESKIERLRGLLKERGLKSGESVEDFQKRIREAETEYQSSARELSNLLFGQIAGKLAKKRLIIVPDGELHYFPVAALPQPDSATDEPILLSNETIYEPSAQTLAVFARSQKQITPAAKNLLVFSDPIFTGDDARLSAENKPAENAATETAQTERFRFVESLGNLPRLSASKDESETIIKIIGASGADNFSGFAATREQLLNLKTADYKIIHFATHGLTDEKRPELSGIVLSRFDEKGQKLDEFFRIQDIYGLDLNADLVVLSACETGIGKEVKGEGLMSLNNAFLQTGAKSVMASLWKVEDGATLELMKNFYGAMKDKNLTPSEALRQAQIKLRENPQYRSPFYWAAFTMQGDFRNVPKISNGFGSWFYLLPIIPLALFGFYVYRRRKIYSTAKP